MLKKIIIPLAALVIIACIGTACIPSNKEYIGGNILNMPFTVQANQEPVIISPWVMNGLTPSLMFRSLLVPDYTLQDNYKADLASKVEVLENAYLYRVHFNSGNKWSDGSEITLEDVVYSIEFISSVPRANYLYKTAFALIDTMEIDGNVLNIRLKERSTNFLPMLAQIKIMPKHGIQHLTGENYITDLYWRDPITSGMFKVGEYVEDSHYQLVENENYTGGKRPKIKEVHLKFDTSENAKLDIYVSNNITEMLNFRAMRGYEEHIVDMLFYRYFVFNIEGDDGNVNKAMKDVRVRQAICMAIDREKLLSTVFYSMGNIVDGPGNIGNLGPYNYNPERAKELLAESGYDLNRPLRFTYYYRDVTSKNFIDEVTKQLEEIGFKVVSKLEGGTDALYGAREYDILLKGYAATQASEWYQEYLTSNPYLPKVFGGHGEMDDLINQLVGEPDKAERDKLFEELSRQELELLYKFPLHTINQSVYINTGRIALPSGFKHGNYFYSFDYNFENWEIKKQ